VRVGAETADFQVAVIAQEILVAESHMLRVPPEA
jgi:hypothetical protein